MGLGKFASLIEIMKKNPNLIGLLITIGIVVVCYLVYAFLLVKKDSYLISNPSEELLKIKIDDQTFSVAPKQITEVEISPGEHDLKFEFNGKTVDTVFNVKYHNGVLNPTRADFYIFTRPYGAARNRDSLFTSQTLTIDEKVFYGNIKHTNDLYIQGFYYNLNVDYPKFFLKKGISTDISKIFSKEDFLQFYFENYE